MSFQDYLLTVAGVAFAVFFWVFIYRTPRL